MLLTSPLLTTDTVARPRFTDTMARPVVVETSNAILVGCAQVSLASKLPAILAPVLRKLSEGESATPLKMIPSM
jgi:hypothetical protein